MAPAAVSAPSRLEGEPMEEPPNGEDSWPSVWLTSSWNEVPCDELSAASDSVVEDGLVNAVCRSWLRPWCETVSRARVLPPPVDVNLRPSTCSGSAPATPAKEAAIRLEASRVPAGLAALAERPRCR